MHCPEAADIGRRLRLLRLERAMPQGELALASFVGQSAISKIEAGLRMPSLDELFALLALLDIDLVEFFDPLYQPGPALPSVVAAKIGSLPDEDAEEIRAFVHWRAEMERRND
jgi:transcriptional regulator with XRE-family HTH domain